MKKIYFVRHAKSSWEYPSLDDFDRPLNKRGIRDAPIMAQHLAKHIGEIDLIISSSANRAKSTAKFFREAISIRTYIESDKLYHAWVDSILEVVNDIDDQYSSALLFGHNPGFTYLYNHFSAESIDNVPTCGLFELTSTAEQWSDIDQTNSDIGIYLYPKMFK